MTPYNKSLKYVLRTGPRYHVRCMEKLIKNKWKIATLTLVTFPISIYLNVQGDNANTGLIAFIGLFPLLFAVTIEFAAEIVSGWRHYKQTGEIPPPEAEGSPVGNKIAVVLAILFGLIFILPIVWVMVSEFL